MGDAQQYSTLSKYILEHNTLIRRFFATPQGYQGLETTFLIARGAGEETAPSKNEDNLCFRPAMRNPPGRHLLRLTNRAVRSSSSSSSAPGAGPGASTSAASPRPRAIADGRPLRASSPPPPSAVAAAAAAYWESRALRRDGEEGDWEEVVAGVPGTGEMEEGEEYRVVFWCPPTIDEVTGAVTSIQE